MTLSAAQDETKTYSSSKSCDWLGWSCKTSVHSTDDKTVVASTFTSGGWIEIEAKTGDIHATATNANAQGSIKLLSDQGNILADAGENSTYNQSYTKKSQWWGLTGSAHNSIDSSTTIEPTWVSAVNDVQLIAHADLTLKAATVKAGGSIDISAQTINFIALQNTVYHYQMDENWGFYASAGSQQGSASVSVGWKDEKTTSSTLEGLAQVTAIEADGNVGINAKGDINSEGAIVAASGSVYGACGRRHQPDGRLRHLYGDQQQELARRSASRCRRTRISPAPSTPMRTRARTSMRARAAMPPRISPGPPRRSSSSKPPPT